jgi:hypothetical protein
VNDNDTSSARLASRRIALAVRSVATVELARAFLFLSVAKVVETESLVLPSLDRLALLLPQSWPSLVVRVFVPSRELACREPKVAPLAFELATFTPPLDQLVSVLSARPVPEGDKGRRAQCAGLDVPEPIRCAVRVPFRRGDVEFTGVGIRSKERPDVVRLEIDVAGLQDQVPTRQMHTDGGVRRRSRGFSLFVFTIKHAKNRTTGRPPQVQVQFRS